MLIMHRLVVLYSTVLIVGGGISTTAEASSYHTGLGSSVSGQALPVIPTTTGLIFGRGYAITFSRDVDDDQDIGSLSSASCARQEAWCASQWWSVGVESVELGITLAATGAAIESCVGTLGASCILVAIGYDESSGAIGEFLGAIDALNACLNED